MFDLFQVQHEFEENLNRELKEGVLPKSID